MLAPLGVGFAALIVLVAAGVWYFLASRTAPVATSGFTSVASNGGVPTESVHLSIVVLPFKNLSGDPGQDYFADGVTDNLTTDLSHIRDSFVIASTTAFTFKAKAIDAKEIGKELGVRYVLEGSVQRDQNRVRVNAQLIDAETGAHLWADRFEEDVADLFKLQDEVVARLANTLGNELVKAEARGDRRIANLDAFDLTMRGRALIFEFLRRPTRETNNAARVLFEQALAINPEDAGALAGDATTYLIEKISGWASVDVDYDAKVLGQADRSIAIARRFGTMNRRPTLGFSRTLRNVSPRWFPSRSGIASVCLSRTFTKPAGSPFGETSIDPAALMLEMTIKGLRSIHFAQCSSM